MRRVLLVTVVLATLLTRCASGGPIRIGALYPLAGPQGGGGSEEEHGVEVAAAWVNSHGGVHGRQVQLVPMEADRPESVPGALDRLKAQGITMVLGSHGSAISAVAADQAGQHGMTFWETGAVGQTAPDVPGGRTFFRLAPMGANLGRAAIDFIGSQVAPHLPGSAGLRYAVAHVDDEYGRAVGAGAASEVQAKGMNLVGDIAYDAHATSFDDVAAKIAVLKPDVLFVAAYLDDGVAVRRAVVARHVPLLANIGTSSSYCMPAFGQALQADGVGLFASDKPDAANVRADALLPEGRTALAFAISTYGKRYHADMTSHALSGFSNGYAVLAHVLPAAHSMKPADVAKAGLTVKLPLGSLANGGGLDIAPPSAPDSGANRNAASVIWEWVAPGVRAVVWPPALATHPVEVLPLAK
jgi:branched-chain amino acid transport system substrate-binding protein